MIWWPAVAWNYSWRSFANEYDNEEDDSDYVWTLLYFKYLYTTQK